MSRRLDGVEQTKNHFKKVVINAIHPIVHIQLADRDNQLNADPKDSPTRIVFRYSHCSSFQPAISQFKFETVCSGHQPRYFEGSDRNSR